MQVMAEPRPWSPIPIHDIGEPLLPLPPQLWRLEPHPYQLLGAPYGPGASPFQLRSGVIERLLMAQAQLEAGVEGWRLAIFDAWRPVAVQQFMVEHTVAEECRSRGLGPASPEAELRAVRNRVARFWADPSPNPATPPPHSTGGAVDLTLADGAGVPLAMGGAIDAIDPVSEPDHYAAAAGADSRSSAAIYQGRRDRLTAVMEGAGFVRHPHEWWHFSFGDQLWAWRRAETAAFYGRMPPEPLESGDG
jgi:D-alanyl-D-alanine dipeptidase